MLSLGLFRFEHGAVGLMQLWFLARLASDLLDVVRGLCFASDRLRVNVWSNVFSSLRTRIHLFTFWGGAVSVFFFICLALSLIVSSLRVLLGFDPMRFRGSFLWSRLGP